MENRERARERESERERGERETVKRSNGQRDKGRPICMKVGKLREKKERIDKIVKG